MEKVINQMNKYGNRYENEKCIDDKKENDIIKIQSLFRQLLVNRI